VGGALLQIFKLSFASGKGFTCATRKTEMYPIKSIDWESVFLIKDSELNKTELFLREARQSCASLKNNYRFICS
jgi:hypothetical protein